MKKYDIIIIGAGAAGLMAATVALARGKRVAVIDMGDAPARKVAVSGGGRCNFTNAAVATNRYFGENPKFIRSAIARTTPTDILDWVSKHNIQWVEKAPGQYFCAGGADDVVHALVHDARGADFFMKTTVKHVCWDNYLFHVHTNNGEFISASVIVATGGISFPAMGVSDIGYKIAKHFGHRIIPPRPALVAVATDIFNGVPAGTTINVEISIGREKIRDSMLITHFGIGGPAVYRATVRDLSDWKINLTPGIDAYELLRAAKQTRGRQSVSTVLGEYMSVRLAKWVCDNAKNIADYKDTELRAIATRINHIIIPRESIKSHGLQSAEVVRGGIDTHDISSKTMESKLRPGLFFAGEVLDIAGDLGGFNLHWAWASGRAAGENA